MQEPVLRSQSYNVVFCIIADDLYGTRLARVISLVTRVELKINVYGCDSFENEENTTHERTRS